MKRYRIVEVIKNYETYYIIEERKWFFWKEKNFDTIIFCTNSHVDEEIRLYKYKFKTSADADEALLNYRPIKYKGIKLKPCISNDLKVEYYFKTLNTCKKTKIINGTLDYMKSIIDEDINKKAYFRRIVKEY